MTEYADNPMTEAAKKQYAAEKEVADQIRAEYASRMRGRPTPTQEEIDHTMLGAHITMHEDDGSGPEPWASRQLEAGKGGAYQTRHVAAAPGQARPAQQHRPPAAPRE